MSASPLERTVVAFNHAPDSPNKVHDAEFAARLGLRGGLVPGVDLFAYLASLATQAWGPGWLDEGSLEARFVRPVYDGDALRVTAQERSAGEMEVLLLDGEGEASSSGVALRRHGEPPPDPAEWSWSPPAGRVGATPEALGGLRRLGTVREDFSPTAVAAALNEVREALPVFRERGLVNPGHLLRLADRLLMENVDLPPWMHVSSRALFYGAVRAGTVLTAGAKLKGLFERKGHRFVQLDVLVVDEARRPVLRVDPYTAIYDPAWNRA